MTTEMVLPGMTSLAPSRKTHGQWRLHRLQMINWGGFEGHHDLTFDQVGTLLSGASGTGKSTILDAHIALMMESSVAFNGASNDSGTGRARSAEQRNVLSYMRGQTDLARDEDTGTTQQVLRGSDRATWSAIAETYRHDDGTEYTALRAYHAPASATSSSQVFTQFIQTPGSLTLTALEPLAAGRFDRRQLRAAFPEFTFYVSYQHFAASLHLRLGIGRDGDGGPAMRMLARIQAGKSITSVDTLYKEMVLERPGTYQAAERTVEHFGVLETSHMQMVTAEAQINALAPTPELADKLETAQTELALLDTFKLTDAHAAGPVTLWAATLRKELLESESRTAKSTSDTAAKDQLDARKDIVDLEGQVKANLQSQKDNGGDALEALSDEIALHAGSITGAETARTELGRRAPMFTLPADEPAFAELQQVAARTLASYDTDRQKLQDEFGRLAGEQYPLSAKAKDLRDELTYLTGRKNLIPRDLDAARTQIAEHVGLEASDLPFVAELIDLDPAYEDWRQAAELLLGGLGRTLLVDRTHSGFRRRLESLKLGNRINFQFVPAHQSNTELDERYLPGRLVFDEDSQFTGWLRSELARQFSYECLLTPDFPDDQRRRITITGQVQNGTRGSHGGHGRAFILGFSTAARAEELLAALEQTKRQLDDLGRRKDTVAKQQRDTEQLKDASGYVLDLRWTQLDADTARQQLTDAQRRHRELLATSDKLPELQAQAEQLRDRLEQRRKDDVRAGDLHDTQRELWEKLVDAEDETSTEIDRLDDVGITVSAGQAQRLMAEYEQYASLMTSDELDGVLAKMRNELLRKTSRARDDVRNTSAQLTQIFTAFLDRWRHENLGTGPESYADFKQILDKLEADGLASRRAEFTKRVIDWSSEDLLGLAGDYEEAFEEIRNRLTPVNEVLASLPYGPADDQLQIKMRQLRDSDVTAFLQELRRLASSTTRITETEVDARFAELRTFITRIQNIPGNGRDQLLDVRRHVHIEAQRVDRTTGAVRASYDSLGSKSGGETQELIAFILGAALRYRLGTSEGGLPAYATVVLDEAFIKADSEFAGRAVCAWQGLGFQLVIGAPLDKVNAIAPYVNRFISVTKRSGYSQTQAIQDADPKQAHLLGTRPGLRLASTPAAATQAGPASTNPASTDQRAAP